MFDNDDVTIPGVELTADLSREDAIPYFLWDEPMTMRELRAQLARSEEDRVRLLGKILREARDSDVWLFTTPGEIEEHWAKVERHLGRRRDFWVFLLAQWREQMKSPSEGLIIDLVKDAAPQLLEKSVIDGILVDPALEILANKLCALLSRAEARDLVDVARLEQAGLDPIAAVALAERKDSGMSAAQLAWVLSTFPVPETGELIHGMSSRELGDFRDSLVRRLTAAAYPKS